MPFRTPCLVALCLGATLLSSAAFPVDVPDAKSDCDAGSKDLVSLAVTTKGDSLLLNLTTREPSDLATLLLFLDTDGNPSTGFKSGIDPKFGFDFVVQGDGLFAFAGKTDRSAWSWERVADVKRTQVAPEQVAIAIDTHPLKSTNIRIAAWTMDDAMQARLDAVPDDKLFPFIFAKPSASTHPAVTMAPPHVDRDKPARERFAKAKSFYTYYGKGRVAELSHYDIVVLHTPAMESADVKKLKSLGVVTVGYVTVGEDDQLRVGDGTGPGGKASWYLDKDHDNQPDQNGIWKSWFANANDPKWRADRVAEAKKLVDDYGFDGIFLDTIDTSQVYPDTKVGMTQLIKELRDALPNGVIVLNQGFEVLPDVAQYADGLMLESFTATYDFDSKTYMLNMPQSIDFHLKRVKNTIEPVRKMHPLQVLVLDYAGKDDRENMKVAADRAATFGYLFSASPIFLDDVYANVPVGKPDPKWLQPQSSPDAMAFTLPADANGFPKGTRLRPSGCFAGYTTEPLVDGKLDRSGMPWAKAAWASDEGSDDNWLEILLPAARKGGKLHLYFHDESGPSRDYQVDVKYAGENQWTTVKKVSGNTARNIVHPLPTAREFTAIRVLQHAGGGSVGRPNLLWLAQVVME